MTVIEFPEGADGDALRRVAGCGNDMTKPMQIDFFIDAPSEDASKRCLERVRARGFDAEVSREEDSERWTVTVSVTMIPNHDEIVDFQNILDDDFSRFGWKTEGWGTFGNIASRKGGSIR